MVPHIITTSLHAIDAQSRVALSELAGLDLCQRLNGRQTAVVGERLRDRVERVGKRAHGVLFQTGGFDRRVLDGETACYFCCAAAVDDAVVAHEVADYAEGVVERAFCFIDDLKDV